MGAQCLPSEFQPGNNLSTNLENENVEENEEKWKREGGELWLIEKERRKMIKKWKREGGKWWKMKKKRRKWEM